MTPTRRIEDMVRSARTTTSAATDARIADAVETAIQKQNEQHRPAVHKAGGIRRMIMNSNWIKFATAAAVVAVIGLGMYALTGSVDVTSITIAQVRQAMQGINWMRMVNKTDENADMQGACYSFASRIEIVYDLEGRIIYNDFNTGTKHVWNPGSEYIYESPIDQTRQFAGDLGEPFELFAHLFDTMTPDKGWSTSKERGMYLGRNVELWIAHRAIEREGAPFAERLIVYIDVETKLPLGIIEYEGIQGNMQLDNNVEITYPETGPADIYEAGAPRTAQIKPSPKQ
jgi:hypothetical protein